MCWWNTPRLYPLICSLSLQVAAKPRSYLPFPFPPQKTRRKHTTMGPPLLKTCLRKDQWGPAHTGLFTINLDQVMCKQGHEREQKSLPGGLALTRASDRSCQVSKWGHMVSQMWCNNMPNACQKEHETSRCDKFSSQCSALIRHRGFMHDWPSTKTLWLETKVGIRLQQRGRLLMRISPYHSFFLSNV